VHGSVGGDVPLTLDSGKALDGDAMLLRMEQLPVLDPVGPDLSSPGAVR
jgi:hypothetical protein